VISEKLFFICIMGLYDTVVGIVNRWKGKRKRDGDDDSIGGSQPKKGKCASTYVLTPMEKTVNIKDKRRHSSYYVHGEEVRSAESRTIEFKAGGIIFGNDFRKLIQKYASAFLNSEGGIILAGVTDDGIVKGVTVNDQQWQRITSVTEEEITYFRPDVNKSFWSIKKIPVVFEGRKPFLSSGSNLVVVEFKFEKGLNEEIYENAVHEVYLRRDGGVHGPLRPLQLRNLIITRYNMTLNCRKKNQKLSNKSSNNVKPLANNVKPLAKEPLEAQPKSLKDRLKDRGITYITID